MLIFSLLQTCYTLIILSEITKQNAVKKLIVCQDEYEYKATLCPDYDKQIKQGFALWRTASFFFTFFWATNLTAHIFFVMKYWMLSRKVDQLTSKKEDKKLNFKAKTLFFIQLFIVFLASVCFEIGNW